MELIAKVSRGSKMDQIYIPRNRQSFPVGDYVLITPVSHPRENSKPYFYNCNNLESVKTTLIKEIFALIEKNTHADNVILTGSFLEKGFSFNDIDLLLVSEKKLDLEKLKIQIEKLTGIKTHLIALTNQSLISGLETDPLYEVMLSKCVSKKRIIFNFQRKINYKLLDLNLLKSKDLESNFDILTGREKYYLTFNLVSILLFIKSEKLSKEKINSKIESIFSIKIDSLKNNLLHKNVFLREYKKIYNQTFNLILGGIKNESK
jgi:predicted nucleotidyltransferase